jgi:hypothetical protein
VVELQRIERRITRDRVAGARQPIQQFRRHDAMERLSCRYESVPL